MKLLDNFIIKWSLWDSVFTLIIVCSMMLVSPYCESAGLNNASDNLHGTINSQLQHADDMFIAHNPKAAIALVEHLAEKYPNNAAIEYKLGELEIRFVGQERDGTISNNVTSRDGLDHLAKAVALEPRNVKYGAMYAVVATGLGMDKYAVDEFHKLYSSNEFRSDLKYRYLVVNYFLSLRRLGRAAEGVEELRKSLVATDYDVKLAISYLYALGSVGDVHGILTFHDEYVKKKGGNVGIEYNTCSELASLRKYHIAAKCFGDMAEDSSWPRDARIQASKEKSRIEKLY